MSTFPDNHSKSYRVAREEEMGSNNLEEIFEESAFFNCKERVFKLFSPSKAFSGME
jgi:hypothetical protein